MEFTDCYKALEVELAVWKAKFLNVSRKFDRLGSSEKEKISPNVADIHIFQTELEDRIEELKNDCPPEWNSDRREIDGFHTGFRKKYAEELAYVGGAPPVAVSG